MSTQMLPWLKPASGGNSAGSARSTKRPCPGMGSVAQRPISLPVFGWFTDFDGAVPISQRTGHLL